MASKLVPISTRISQEDVEFISQLTIPGATTPSDKLRHIIADAKVRANTHRDYRSTLAILDELIQPVIRELRNAEHDHAVHSEVLTRVTAWLPEIMAFTIASVHTIEEITLDDLKDFEAGLLDRIFRLFESMTQLALTNASPCYQQLLLDRHIQPILTMSKMISEKTKEKNNE